MTEYERAREGRQIAAQHSQWDMIQNYLMAGETEEARAIVWC